MQTLSNAEALERLALRRERFIRIALKRNVPPGEAEDVAHDTYLKAAEHMGALKNPESFDYWADRIAVNTAMDYHRKSTKERNIFVSLEERRDLWYDKEEHGETVDEFFTDDELRSIDPDVLKRALSGLNTRELLVFRLHVQKGYKFKDIAAMLDISDTNARVIYHRAKEKLEKHLNEYLKEEERL